MSTPASLGSGLGYRPQFRAELFLRRSEVDFLEIIADHYFDASPEKLAELDLLGAHFPLVPHGLDLSLGGADGVEERYVEKFARLIECIRAPYWSEHLCFTKAGGVPIGHLAALPCTQEALDVIARNVEIVRKTITTPLVLENVTAVVVVPGAEMSEAEFVAKACAQADCGWLCDVANLYANSVNHGPPLDESFDHWPWDRLAQIHYAGGRWKNNFLIDSHDSATAEPVWELFERVARRAPAKNAILERDENLPPFPELLTEVARARRLLEGA